MPILTLRENCSAGEGLVRLCFVEPVTDYTKPGQFVTVHVPGYRPAFFAIANLPGQPAELLVKDIGETTHHLTTLQPGHRVEMSAAMGAGFLLDLDDPSPWVVLASGSGISAIYPLIEQAIARGDKRDITVLYGVRTLEQAVFRERWEAWERYGIDFRVVLSNPDPHWRGLRGYVQDVAEVLGLIEPHRVAIVCGSQEMQRDVRTRWLDAGASEAQIHTNW